jgi:hypothetical protein
LDLAINIYDKETVDLMKPAYNPVFRIVYAILVFVLAFSCARMSSPTGGPNDEEPPVPLKSHPVNYATNFKGEKILIQFDEFIVLNNISQELLVSPPLPEKPITKLRGKKLIVNINNNLQDTTTYNFNFYNAIGDLNENNPLTNFQFEFSTGPVFDSLYLGGTLSNAFNYKTEASMLVMLYEQFNDTVPRTTKPAYIAKTNENGQFIVPNLKNRPYYVFGLNDMNNNLLFDMPNEAIAFIDSTYQPGFVEKTFTDTLRLIKFISPDKKDTLMRDSIVYRTEMVSTIENIHLFFFTEDYKPQFFNQSYRKERQQVIFAFNRPVDSNFNVTPITDKNIQFPWFVEEKQALNDSIVYWIKDSALFNQDSLFFSLNYTLKDSNHIDYIKTDTVLCSFETKPEPKSKKKNNEKKAGLFNLNIFDDKKDEALVDSTPPPSELTFKCNAKTPFELNAPVEFLARFPIASINTSQIVLNQFVNDTVKKAIKFDLKQDSLNFRNYKFNFQSKEEEKYELYIPKGSFTDIYSNTNDSLKYLFTTRALDFYSTIKIHVFGVFEPSVLQLMNEKETVLEERFIWGDTTLVYEYLTPQKYIFKLFYDTNANKKWDTGNLKQKQQPEAVFYFPQEIETKSNWDMEYEWELYPVGPPDMSKNEKGGANKKMSK